MSHETIRWYSHVFDAKPELFKKQIERLINKNESQIFWKKIEQILVPVGLALHAKMDMKARAKLMTGDFS